MSVTELTSIGVRVPTNLADQLREMAERNERSLAAEVRLALKAHVERNVEREGAA